MSDSCKCSEGKIRPDFKKGDGLVPVIVQDHKTGQVLMMAYMNEESYSETLKLGYAVYYSRSRQKLWRKGEESGNVQKIHEIYIDCDCDTLLIKVEQVGGSACHEGYPSCFFRKLEGEDYVVVGERVFDPSKVYKK
ncbi:MAG: phosphoribosyl-AMP cyclohydrolase [Thermoguttaceae bacterium]